MTSEQFLRKLEKTTEKSRNAKKYFWLTTVIFISKFG